MKSPELSMYVCVCACESKCVVPPPNHTRRGNPPTWEGNKSTQDRSALGCLRTWFQRWRDRGQRAAQRRVQLERAAQHDHQRLLLRGMARWKAHHLCCVRKRVRQAAATQVP